MKQIYYAIQSTLHGRGSNVTKVISLSLGLTIGVLLFSQIAFELNYEKCYPDADRLVLVRGGGENVKTGEKGEGYDDSLFAPMAEAFRSDLSQWIENATVIFNFETLNVFKDGHKLKDVNYAYVDTCYFRTFGIKVLKGILRNCKGQGAYSFLKLLFVMPLVDRTLWDKNYLWINSMN